MQFRQLLSTVNSPHCHTNGQSSVQHGRQQWTEKESSAPAPFYNLRKDRITPRRGSRLESV